VSDQCSEVIFDSCLCNCWEVEVVSRDGTFGKTDGEEGKGKKSILRMKLLFGPHRFTCRPTIADRLAEASHTGSQWQWDMSMSKEG
jgi:hypothetical protein